MKPGRNFESLDDESVVLRFVISNNPSDEIGANEFSLSTTDKNAEPHRLSVWEKSLAPVALARKFVTNPKRSLVVEFKVVEIRSLEDEVEGRKFGLDVKWDYLPDCYDEGSDQKLPSTQAGCEGHCGIFNVYPPDKKLQRRIRAKLADLANGSIKYLLEETSE